MRLVLSADAEDAMLEAVRRLLDGGELRLYDSFAPSSPNAPVSLQQHLATVAFTETRLADGQVRGVLEQDLAIGSGQATWARAYAPDETPILDCDVGETGSGAAIELNTVGLRKGGPVVIRSFALGIQRS